MSEPRAVNEATRTIEFLDGRSLALTNVTEVDNSGSYLRITADEGYVLVNPANVLYHIVPVEAKVF
jgi:hypothetical protein